MSINDTLAEREQQHGSFETHCEIEAKLRDIIDLHMGTKAITTVQRIGLGMIVHKLARILNNGHQHIDSWHDIAGYSTLVEQSMTPTTCSECGADLLGMHEPDCSLA